MKREQLQWPEELNTLDGRIAALEENIDAMLRATEAMRLRNDVIGMLAACAAGILVTSQVLLAELMAEDLT